MQSIGYSLWLQMFRGLCLSVTTVSSTKMVELIELPFGGIDSGGTKRPGSPRGSGSFGASHGPLQNIANIWHVIDILSLFQ